MQIDENLKNLISDWAFRRGREASATAFLENPRLPETLLTNITAAEPFRSRAVADAKIVWSMPFAIGFGMELFFPETISVESFQSWRETVRNFTAQMEYCDRMDGTDCTRYDVRLERIGREDGEWRIIEIFDRDGREKMNKIAAGVKNLFTGKDK